MQGDGQRHRHRNHPASRKVWRQVRRLPRLAFFSFVAAPFPSHPIKLTIQYYALLREQRGLPEETLETSAATPEALYAELATAHGFTLAQESLQVAVNDAFAQWQTPLSDGDTLVFIPPVAGG